MSYAIAQLTRNKTLIRSTREGWTFVLGKCATTRAVPSMDHLGDFLATLGEPTIGEALAPADPPHAVTRTGPLHINLLGQI